MSRLPRSCRCKCSKSSCESCDEEVVRQYETEIWIYTKSLHIFTSANDEFVKSKDNQNEEDITVNSLVPVFQHWILVAKFQGSTLWMEASERDGLLQTDILDAEPEDIESRTLIDVVKTSIPEMMQVFSSSKLIGKKYSLSGANCQSLIKDILKELAIEKELIIINNTADINDKSNSNSKIAPEIWIYTKSVNLFNSSRRDFLSSSDYLSGKKSYIMKALIPVFKHWILVVKFQSTTFWMEANEVNGILRAQFLEDEPDDVEDRCFLGTVDLSVKEMYSLYKKNHKILVGSKYSLAGANCQTWALSILKEFGIGENLTIINEVVAGAQAGIGISLVGFGVLFIDNFTKEIVIRFKLIVRERFRVQSRPSLLDDLGSIQDT